VNIRDLKRQVTEFDVQAEAYARLRLSYWVVGEVVIKVPGERGVRLDLLVLHDNGDFCFSIEVKRAGRSRPHSKVDRYERVAGVPNVQICGMEEAERVLEICEPWLATIRSA